MSVKMRPYKRGGWEVDIRFEWPDGTPYRGRFRSPTSSKSAAQRWGQAREVDLLRQGRLALEAQKKEVPTLEEFGERFVEGYAVANRQKASTIDSKRSALRVHLNPRFGRKKLDAIKNEDIQRLKADLIIKSPKTVNNILSVLSKLLKVAVDWEVIDQMPCRIRLLRVSEPVARFYEYDPFGRLVEAARKLDRRYEVMVLLAGDAGLRRGEIMALRQCDVDFRRGQLVVEKSIVRGIEGTPKSGHGRIVPMTEALAAALQAHRHLRGERVLLGDDGAATTPKVLRSWMVKVQRRAGLEANGGLHILRHTFCSHLAMRGAPAKAVQELAGHQSLSTTLRYMHLSPAARESAIRLLDRGRSEEARGDTLETASGVA